MRSRSLSLCAVLFLVFLGCLACADHGGDNHFGPDQTYDLSVTLLSFNPHVGQTFKLRVVDVDTGEERGRIVVGAVPAPDFTVALPDSLVALGTYHVDFYADLSAGAGSADGYDPPPTDHAWRLTVGPVSGDVSIQFPHDLDWTDIAFPD